MIPAHPALLHRLGTAALMAVLTAPALAHEHARLTALPPGPEKPLVEELCTRCHTVERLLGAGGTLAGWQDRILRMNRWGARVPAEMTLPIARYLAAALPPRPRTIETVGYTASSAVQEVRIQDIQRTVRVAARALDSLKAAFLDVPDGDRRYLVSGQRVRLFAPQQRGRFTPAVITVNAAGPSLLLKSELDPQRPGSLLVAEIPVILGRHLAVANDALQSDSEGYSVFVQIRTGGYEQRRIRVGESGDLVTQVTAGLSPGEQVVSLGAFFIDAEHRMGVMQ